MTSIESILARQPRAIARAATLIENRSVASEALLQALWPHTGTAEVFGITGAPGVGKSTFVTALIRELRQENKTVAVIAVDPTSPFSGGAILGDRVRMQEHHGDPGVFIRSMATRGKLGGLAPTTLDLTLLLDAAGFNVILVETVGVGQDEIDIANMADATAVVLVPGMGDEVQAIKAGILEIADVLVINKSDLDGAPKLEAELQMMLSLAHRLDNWVPTIVRTIATEGQGIAQSLTALRSFKSHSKPKDRQRQRWIVRLEQLLREKLSNQISAEQIEEAARAVTSNESDPYAIVNGWLKQIRGTNPFEIDHLGIAVKSIDNALGFYRDALGLTVEHRETVVQEKVNVALLPAGKSKLELLEASDPESTIAKFIANKGEGLHHIALRVPDLSTSVERLKSQGARILNEPQLGAGGHKYVFVHPRSTGGVLLELIEER